MRYFYQLLVSTLLAYYYKVLLSELHCTNRNQLLVLHATPIRYLYVTSEPENNKVRLQVRFTAFTSLRKRKKYVHSEM